MNGNHETESAAGAESASSASSESSESSESPESWSRTKRLERQADELVIDLARLQGDLDGVVKRARRLAASVGALESPESRVRRHWGERGSLTLFALVVWLETPAPLSATLDAVGVSGEMVVGFASRQRSAETWAVLSGSFSVDDFLEADPEHALDVLRSLAGPGAEQRILVITALEQQSWLLELPWGRVHRGSSAEALELASSLVWTHGRLTEPSGEMAVVEED